eukprot:CAMPEP_0117573494 /NCGR_PEP_ID=MMETSP0784-20121206/60992_1 /TAXON_ID=39447 /ORGANISM="" /LENGTH=165 /DNA_ID=CAMNT_0005372079 /DNA_START=35 /DNA_END=528 /DNA_ORIENTATION=-
MARAGVANYCHSTDHPVKSNSYWRDCINKEQQNHAYHPLNDPAPQASYAHLNTTSNDFMSRTWQLLHHTRSVAAGKCSFHHNVAKPLGAARASATSASFERMPHPRTAGKAVATQVLGASASQPLLRTDASTLRPDELARLGSRRGSSRSASARGRTPFDDAWSG